MIINGIKLQAPEPRVLVIPFGEDNLVFKAKYIGNFDGFEKICPEPQPPERIDNKGLRSLDYEHPSYIEKLAVWNERKFQWLYITSLSATEGLEWEHVKLEDPETWSSFEDEFKDLSSRIVERIKYHVIETCGLDASRIEEATKRFLADRQQEQNVSSSPSTGK